MAGRYGASFARIRSIQRSARELHLQTGVKAGGYVFSQVDIIRHASAQKLGRAAIEAAITRTAEEMRTLLQTGRPLCQMMCGNCQQPAVFRVIIDTPRRRSLFACIHHRPSLERSAVMYRVDPAAVESF